MSLPAPTGSERPFDGQRVAVSGRLALLSRREARALVAGLGGQLVGDPTAATVTVSEEQLCRAAGLPDAETLRGQYYSSRDLRAMYPVLRDDHLRYLTKCGLVRPIAGRYYSFADLHVVKHAAADLERGVSLNASMRGLAAERAGQLAFDFQPGARGERGAVKVMTVRTGGATARAAAGAAAPPPDSANAALAARFFLEGAEVDDGEDPDLERAATAYRKALMCDPTLVPALVNLANIHYERDQLVEAEALYERAIRLDEACFEAYFNLGNIHHDLSRYADAVNAYVEALAINPDYPEAHFYLAVTLEKLGRGVEARTHWKAYCELAPDGEFVALAKEFSTDPPRT